MGLNEADQLIVNSFVDPDVMPEPKYPYDNDFLRMVLGTLLCNRFFLNQSVGLIKPVYFKSEVHQIVSRLLFQYFEKYKQPPSKIFIKELVEEHLKKRYHSQDDNYRAIRLLYIAEVNLVYDYYTKGGVGNMMPMLDSPDAILDKIANFAKHQAIKSAFAKSVDIMRRNPEGEDTWDKIDELYKEARLVNRNVDLGLNYFESLEERYARLAENVENAEVFTTSFRSSDKALMGGGLMRGEMGAIMGNGGTGKCFLGGTGILMYDGSVKNVEDVVVGDLVMGNNSTPRKVLETHSFVDEVYEIRPVKGNSYFVNGKHILSLKSCLKTIQKRNDRPKKTRKNLPFHRHPSKVEGMNLFNISVEDFLKQSNRFKYNMKGWRVGVEWEKKEVKIDPYFLGIWLGDGHKNTSGITNVEKPVIAHTRKIAAKRRLNIRTTEMDSFFIYSKNNHCRWAKKGISKNTLLNDLYHYNLINNKHIPQDYKINDRETRLQLLAGIMDSDGHNHRCGGYDFVNKNKQLALDVVFLVRSLGLAAYMSRCKKKCQTGGYYWRVSISGDCSIIPVKIRRKKCSPKRQIKDVLVTGVKILPKKHSDKFYGFETDENHLFLLSDFTVVHNSILLTQLSGQNILQGKKVLYISTEMDADRIASRFDCQMSAIGYHQLMPKKEEVWKALRDHIGDYEDKRRLVIKQFPSGTADMAMIRAYHSQQVALGFRPDLLIIDYPGDMKDYSSLSGWDARFRLLREIRGFGGEENHCTWVAVHPNRSSKELGLEEFMDETNQSDCFKQFQIFDFFMTLNQTGTENKANIGRIFIAKTRNGKSRFSFKIKYHFKDQTLRLEEITQQAYTAEMTKIQDSDADDVETSIDKIYVDKPKFHPSDGERIG